MLLCRRGGGVVIPIMPLPQGLALIDCTAGRWTWRTWALWQAHSGLLGGHLPYDKSLGRLKAWAYWRGMATDMIRYCAACKVCLMCHGHASHQRTRAVHPRRPFEVVQIHLQGPLSPASYPERWRYILTCICVSTRYPLLKGITNKNASIVAKTLLECMFECGAFSRVIMSDNGTEFINALFKELLSILQIRHRLSPAYSPHVTGLA